MTIRIALAGNPNSGKTTLFNALTGANQYVGNWPGVTVEKKEGRLKPGLNPGQKAASQPGAGTGAHAGATAASTTAPTTAAPTAAPTTPTAATEKDKGVTIIDLPGIYSLSPYTLEEVIARNYLIDERPDVLLNIIDGTNLERNLYLSTQLVELGIPMVLAVNMMDVVNKSGDKINLEQLSKELGCKVVAISALKGTGVAEAAAAAVAAASGAKPVPLHSFSGIVEHTLAHIEEAVLHDLPEEQQRWYAIKLFERDAKIIERLQAQNGLKDERLQHIESDIVRCEDDLDDDSESIITAERYSYIDSIIKGCVTIKSKGKLTTSDKIDRVVTNRFAALPIFAVVMFLVYFISVTSVGTIFTDWANDGVFGDGWYLAGVGGGAYEEAVGEFDTEQAKIEAYLAAADEKNVDTTAVTETLESEEPDESVIDSFVKKAAAAKVAAEVELTDDEGEVTEVLPVDSAAFQDALAAEEPDPTSFGLWIPGVPVLLGGLLEAANTADWLQGLLLDGIVAGVGAVLGFVPQMLVLFLLLAFLEGCGYMARIAFIMDRVFRRFGLSGKSFVPILIGTGCGVPGIMSSRTIESERDRRMTVMTTTFIPCSAKLPVIALIAGALFGGAWWVGASAYFIGIAAIICSGIILKKTRLFSGDVAPFVMELPSYHMPTPGSILRTMWERAWSFIKRAGTIILLATIFIWFTSGFGWVDGEFGMVDMNDSMLAAAGSAVAWIFNPLGWGDWKSAVATITGLIAKENVVGTFGVLFNFAEVSENGDEIWSQLAMSYTTLSAFSLLVFNLLCAPCFAAIGAIRREMHSAKWFWIAIGYQCIFAYIVALCIFQIGSLVAGGGFSVWTVVAILLILGFLFMLFRPMPGKKKKSLEANAADSTGKAGSAA